MEGDIFRGQRTLCVDSPEILMKGEVGTGTVGEGREISGARDGVLVKTGDGVPEVKRVEEGARHNKSQK